MTFCVCAVCVCLYVLARTFTANIPFLKEALYSMHCKQIDVCVCMHKYSYVYFQYRKKNCLLPNTHIHEYITYMYTWRKYLNSNIERICSYASKYVRNANAPHRQQPHCICSYRNKYIAFDVAESLLPFLYIHTYLYEINSIFCLHWCKIEINMCS